MQVFSCSTCYQYMSAQMQFMKIPENSHFTTSLKWLPWLNLVMTDSGDEIHCFIEDINRFIFIG